MSSDFLQLVREQIGLLLFLNPRTLWLKCPLHLGHQTCPYLFTCFRQSGENPSFASKAECAGTCCEIVPVDFCHLGALWSSGLGGIQLGMAVPGNMRMHPPAEEIPRHGAGLWEVSSRNAALTLVFVYPAVEVKTSQCPLQRDKAQGWQVTWERMDI